MFHMKQLESALLSDLPLSGLRSQLRLEMVTIQFSKYATFCTGGRTRFNIFILAPLAGACSLFTDVARHRTVYF